MKFKTITDVLKSKLMRVLSVLILFFSVFLLKAQPGPPNNPPPPNPVPITGIEILLGAGALLGAKRYLNSRKEKT